VIELTCPNWVAVSMFRKLASTPESCLMSPPQVALFPPQALSSIALQYRAPMASPDQGLFGASSERPPGASLTGRLAA
jgi:hypothetical protein